ncbi:hypothetical protein AB0L82_35445 [Nocardia sp. NPDC052001]|uniref:hypothetical protein n=1 Tax=Nocardia sp. NPDC052001 TaxID=3154853 RepID=UPI00341BC10E
MTRRRVYRDPTATEFARETSERARQILMEALIGTLPPVQGVVVRLVSKGMSFELIGSSQVWPFPEMHGWCAQEAEEAFNNAITMIELENQYLFGLMLAGGSWTLDLRPAIEGNVAMEATAAGGTSTYLEWCGRHKRWNIRGGAGAKQCEACHCNMYAWERQFRRGGREQRFCGPTCRKAASRAKKLAPEPQLPLMRTKTYRPDEVWSKLEPWPEPEPWFGSEQEAIRSALGSIRH